MKKLAFVVSVVSVVALVVAGLRAADPLPGGAKQVLFSWNPVTQYTDGSPCTPSGYEVAVLAAGKDPNVAAPADFLARMNFLPASTLNQDVSALFAGRTALTYTLAIRTVKDGSVSTWVPCPIAFLTPMAPTGVKATVITIFTTG